MYHFNQNVQCKKPYVIMVERKSESEEIRLFSDGNVQKINKSFGKEIVEPISEKDRIAYVRLAMSKFEDMVLNNNY